jgi:hypothetical protein
VQFRFDSDTPFPFMICYCSICRKLIGSAGGVNIRGNKKTLGVMGAGNIKRYHAVMREKGKRPQRSSALRTFCGACGAHLWLEEPKSYPNDFWPNAGVIDTPLPVPKEFALIFASDRPKWLPMPKRATRHTGYPSFSILEWHEKRGLRG